MGSRVTKEERGFRDRKSSLRGSGLTGLMTKCGTAKSGLEEWFNKLGAGDDDVDYLFSMLPIRKGVVADGIGEAGVDSLAAGFSLTDGYIVRFSIDFVDSKHRVLLLDDFVDVNKAVPDHEGDGVEVVNGIHKFGTSPEVVT